ncbi:uncharacterized protein PV07_00157, partial [Cladophialophora immunda]
MIAATIARGGKRDMHMQTQIRGRGRRNQRWFFRKGREDRVAAKWGCVWRTNNESKHWRVESLRPKGGERESKNGNANARRKLTCEAAGGRVHNDSILCLYLHCIQQH